MKRILFSWIGQKDLDVNKVKDKPYSEPGPLISTIKAMKFSKAYFLYNYPSEKVKPYLNWLDENKIIEHDDSYADLSSPTAFQEIYPIVDKKLKTSLTVNFLLVKPCCIKHTLKTTHRPLL